MNKNFRTWLKSANIDVKEGSYYRQEAEGHVHFYHLSPPKNNSQTVIYIHGTGNDGSFLTENLFSLLIKDGYNIFTFDIDGHGSRSTSKLFGHHLDSCIFSAYKQLCKIAEEPEQLHMIGYSIGGLLALKEFSRRRIPIDKLVSIATPFHLKLQLKKIYKELFTLTQKEFYSFGRRWGINALLPAFGPFNRKRFPIRLAEQNHMPWGYINFVEEFANNTAWKNLTINASDVILGIFGKQDHIVDLEKAIEIFGKWQQSDLIILPRANHYSIAINNQALGYVSNFLAR